jgi:hypothetical protein
MTWPAICCTVIDAIVLATHASAGDSGGPGDWAADAPDRGADRQRTEDESQAATASVSTTAIPAASARVLRLVRRLVRRRTRQPAAGRRSVAYMIPSGAVDLDLVVEFDIAVCPTPTRSVSRRAAETTRARRLVHQIEPPGAERSACVALSPF